MHKVLFLCIGHAARSILAEVSLDDPGAGRFRGFIAGREPVGLTSESGPDRPMAKTELVLIDSH